MKTNSIRAIGASLLLFLAGCSTTQTGTSTFTPERAQRAARSAALGGASVFLIKNPNGRSDLERVQVILSDLASRKVWDLQLVADALLQANLKELRSVEAVLIIETSVGLIDALSGDRISLAVPVMAEAVIRGALEGVTAALKSVPPQPSAFYVPGDSFAPWASTVANRGPSFSLPSE